MHARLTTALLLAALGTCVSHADTIIIPSDLAVTMTATPDRGLLPYQIIDLTITVTNRGPVSVRSPFLYSGYFGDEFALGFASNDCNLSFAVLDGDGYWAYTYLWHSLNSPDLAVGQSKVCHAKMALSRTAPSIVPFTFRVSEEYVDPDPRNDVATIYLQRAVVPVPDHSLVSQISLVLLLIVSASWTVARRRNRGRRMTKFAALILLSGVGGVAQRRAAGLRQ